MSIWVDSEGHQTRIPKKTCSVCGKTDSYWFFGTSKYADSSKDFCGGCLDKIRYWSRLEVVDADGIECNRIKQILVVQRIRCRKAGVASDLTFDQWKTLLLASGGCCHYCKKYVGINALVVEHKIPVFHGGGNTLSNVVPACRNCNSLKRAKLDWKPIEKS